MPEVAMTWLRKPYDDKFNNSVCSDGEVLTLLGPSAYNARPTRSNGKT